MEKLYYTSYDDDVMARKVYAKTGDLFAYADAKYTQKISAEDLHHAFLAGMVVVDAAGVEYLPISCKVADNVATVTYVLADQEAVGAVDLATVKSE